MAFLRKISAVKSGEKFRGLESVVKVRNKHAKTLRQT